MRKKEIEGSKMYLREREVWSKEERNWQKENVRLRYAESGIRKSNLLNWSESVMEKGKRERMGEM